RQNRLYSFVLGKFRHDRIEHLDLRSILGSGVGYQWLKTPDVQLSTPAGLSWVHEEFSNAPTRESINAQVGYALEKRLWAGSVLRNSLNYYPNLSDSSEYLMDLELAVEQAVAGSIFVNLRMVWAYTSNPAPDAKHNSTHFLFGIGTKL